MTKEIYWLNSDSRKFLSRGYLAEGQTAEERIRVIAETAERILKKPGFADKFEDYMHRGWISLASPVWSNFGMERGLPISCNGSYIPDSIAGILDKGSEVGMMTKMGAGTSAYFGAIRPRGSVISTGGSSDGPVHYMELYDTITNLISQSQVRRGHLAAYLDIDHPDIKEFLESREEGSKIQNISLGVCVTDEWMQAMIDGDSKKRKIWARVIQKRSETGYPYIFFTDTVNRGKPQWYKDKDMKIHASNMCVEIALPSSEDESFVCCLSSLNVIHWDDWKDSDLVETVTYFLDAVMEEYIIKTEGMPSMEHARNFAIRNRAIGIGTLGWHSYLQSKMIPYRAVEARRLNIEIHKFMDERSWAASKEMAEIYGEPEHLKGYGQRNGTRLATAPTTSSSFILGQASPSDEPENSNYYTKDLAKGKFGYKNPYLKALLKTKGMDTKEIWDSILISGGSVQHLEFLDENEKAVFETFGEIPQIEVIMQAADRQPYIDQSQSLNLMIHPSASVKDINALMISGWELGIKTFYYQRSTNPAQEFARDLLSCQSCAL